jgi:hypothetical protein
MNSVIDKGFYVLIEIVTVRSVRMDFVTMAGSNRHSIIITFMFQSSLIAGKNEEKLFLYTINFVRRILFCRSWSHCMMRLRLPHLRLQPVLRIRIQQYPDQIDAPP